LMSLLDPPLRRRSWRKAWLPPLPFIPAMTDVLDKSLSAVVLWWPGTGDRMALSGAAAASLAGSPHPEDPAAVAGPVCLLLDFWRHPATSCS
jgi:hypothetical protein